MDTEPVKKKSFEQLTKYTRFKKDDDKEIINKNVLETWLNETLGDAEHMDIPGCVM